MISDAPQSGFYDLASFVEALLRTDWESPHGPMRLATDLSSQELSSSPFFLNSRIFLETLATEKASATATGNLSRAFVASIFDRLAIPESERQLTRSVCKVINEMDVWPLHLARVISEIAKLVIRRNKAFQLTKLGRELLQEQRAGELYRRLFIAYFRRFDLRYAFHLREVRSIQPTIPVILWRLSIVARDWVSIRGLAPQLLLPDVHADLCAAMINPHDTEEWIFGGYVLDPLCDFGLVETNIVHRVPRVEDKDLIRTTELWSRFIKFPTDFAAVSSN